MKDPKITVVSGEFGCGKTLFALTTGHPMEKVVIFDVENSAYQYEDMGFDRVDLLALVKEEKSDWKPEDLWEVFVREIQSLETGRYDVIALDPISELEQGLTTWLGQHPEEMGKTRAQYQKSGGLFWGDVKSLEKRVLLDIASKCEMLIITAHMRDRWKGQRPTGDRERKGKTTLTEVADLELVLKRTGEQVIPSALVAKMRWIWINPKDPTDIRPALPPRLDVATWKAIRAYSENPPKWDSLKPEEKVQKQELLSEDERLILKAEIARGQAEPETEEKREPEPKIKCADCGQEITRYTDDKRDVGVAQIIELCTEHGLPAMCINCAKKAMKETEKKGKKKKEKEKEK